MAKTTAGESQRSTYSLETAGNFHFLAALYFEPSAALTMRCVLGSKPRFALLTKYSCTLQNSNTQMQVTAMSPHAKVKKKVPRHDFNTSDNHSSMLMIPSDPQSMTSY